ncbi:unnamed protein product [Urochloa decumbens]
MGRHVHDSSSGPNDLKAPSPTCLLLEHTHSPVHPKPSQTKLLVLVCPPPFAAAAAAASSVVLRSPRSKAASLAPSKKGEEQMKAGRKNLRRACDEGAAVTLAEGESIMQVLTLRGSNVIEVMDGEGVKSLALFPAKFQKSFWIKSGSFVVVDASGREQAMESGSKIACVVSQVLFHEQVRALQKSGSWPAIFKSSTNEGSEAGKQAQTTQVDKEPAGTQAQNTQVEGEPESDEDDDLPPLEANTNRNRPYELYSDSDSGSDS